MRVEQHIVTARGAARKPNLSRSKKRLLRRVDSATLHPVIRSLTRAVSPALLCLLLLPHATFAVGESVNGFPNWAERVILEWTNRARVDPQVEMTACGSACAEKACYQRIFPLSWNLALNRAARFHSDEQLRQGYFAHASACTVVSMINSSYPAACDGSASCACVGGVKACSPSCTSFDQRIALFGGIASGEIIASPVDPNVAFYLWLFEPYGSTACGFTTANGHRWLIFQSNSSAGPGVSGPATVDFGYGAAPTQIPSGSHYPRQAAAVDVWANWYDASAPLQSFVNIDGSCSAMTLGRGTAQSGAYHATITTVATGCHRYYFSFTDARGNVVEYPTTGSLGIGPQASCADWASSRPASCAGVIATPTASVTASRTPSATPTGAATSTPLPTPFETPCGQVTRSNCPGDCDGNGTVTIGELTRCIRTFLGEPLCNTSNPAVSCGVADLDHSGAVSIGEVTACTNRFLNGC